VKNVLSVKNDQHVLCFWPNLPFKHTEGELFYWQVSSLISGLLLKTLISSPIMTLDRNFCNWNINTCHNFIHIYIYQVLRALPTSSSPLLEVPSMFHTRGLICQWCLKWNLNDSYWQFCKLSPHFCLYDLSMDNLKAHNLQLKLLHTCIKCIKKTNQKSVYSLWHCYQKLFWALCVFWCNFTDSEANQSNL
jgi:hypothetical protein